VKRALIVGAGSFGQLLAKHLGTQHTLVGYVDDTKSGRVGELPVLGDLGAIERLHTEGAFDTVVLGIGYLHLAFRAKLAAHLRSVEIQQLTWIHPASFISPDVELGQGVLVFPGCTVDVGARLDEGVVLQVGCVIAHDTTIGAHSFLGPGVKVAGFVRVGNQSFLGAGTILIDGITLGDRTQTGAGAVVVKSNSGNELLVGVPARTVRKR